MTEISVILGEAVGRVSRGKEVAVAFSGGLDSGLVARHAKHHAECARLYAVGTADSHDVLAAKNSAERLGMPLEIIGLEGEDIIGLLGKMISITGTVNPLTLAFELPLFLVCRECAEKHVITGQGADELFGGYAKYSGLDEKSFSEMRSEDMIKLKGPTLAHEDATAGFFGKEILRPYLDGELWETVGGMDIRSIMPEGEERKKILREAARAEGLDWLAEKPKKAAQYGSGLMDMLRIICRKEGVTYSELVSRIAGGVL